MGETSGRREHLRLIGSILFACIIGALLAAVTAAVILRYVAVEAPSKRYDDVEKILSQYDPESFRGAAVAADGSLRVELEKNDLYWYASEFGILDRFEQRLEDFAAASGWEIRRYGFQMEGEQLVLHLYAARRLPAYFRVVYDIDCQGTVMNLRPTEVAISGYMELPEERWPTLLPREGFRLDFAELGICHCLRSVSTQGSALVLEGDGFAQAFSGQLLLDMSILNALDVYGWDAVDHWDILSWAAGLGTDKVPMAEAHERIMSSGNAVGALAELLACCTGASRLEVFSGWDRFTLEFAAVPVEEEAAEYRRMLERYVAAEQWKYEKLLTSIREMYKSGALCLGDKSLHLSQSGEEFDHTGLTSGLSITPIDSRVVLLYTDRGGAQCIRTTDMPPLSEVPKLHVWAARTLDYERIYDIGILLTTEGDVMALAHYRNDGTFVLRQVTEAVFTELLLCKTIPTLCIDELHVPADRTPMTSISPISPYEVILLP